jgi:hypothetical protein
MAPKLSALANLLAGKPSLPQPLVEAMQEAEAVLAERARLETLQAELQEQQRQAEARQAQALENRDRAEADLLLGKAQDRAELEAAAHAARDAAEAAARDAGRYAAALRALPAKLAEADARLEAAAAAMTDASQEVRDRLVAALDAEVQAMLRQLARALHKGYAIRSTLGGLGRALDEAFFPSLTANGPPLLRNGVLALSDGATSLSQGFRDDPAAAALASTYQPVRLLQERLEARMRRIEEAREIEHRAEQQRSRAEAFERGNGRVAYAQPKPAAAEEPRWNGTSDTPRGAPIEMSLMHQPGSEFAGLLTNEE